MVYDQAQSPRLGQRVPVESTFVQSYDVDPTNDVADLLEAAWPGMLIHRSDLKILMIFNASSGAWEPIGGGEEGHNVYVGPTPPTGGSYVEGDQWYDDDDGMKAYVWSGTAWVLPGGAFYGGVHIFRQPTIPTSLATGDIWYDSDAGDTEYRAETSGANAITDLGATPAVLGWTRIRDSVAQGTADTKVQSYYAPGFDPADLGDPRTLIPITGHTIGDIWYQTDDNNRVWFYTGNPAAANGGWVDASDPNALAAMTLANENFQALTPMQDYLGTALGLAYSAENSSDTADGRVSMSDYRPGPDDLTYPATKYSVNMTPGASFGEITTSIEQVSRVNGSIWFTRTRVRTNYCTNPSFETNTNFWTSNLATIAREAVANEPSGDWTLKVTNSATAGDHVVTWGQATPAPCLENQVWTASIYTELLTGTGTGVHLDLVWVDSGGSILAIDQSDLYDQILNAWDEQLRGTALEPRVYIDGTAPAGATGVYLRMVSPSGNESATWHMGAALLERYPSHGRYFDGSPEASQDDGYWGEWDKVHQKGLGIAHNSVSSLHGDKIQEIWELRDSAWFQKYLVNATIVSLDAAKLTGEIPGQIIADNSIAPDKAMAALVIAFEALSYGDLVNVFNNSDVPNVRKADAASGKEAHGYVLETVTVPGTAVHVYHLGFVPYDPLTSNLPTGPHWLSTVPGQISSRPPSSAGQLVQRVGVVPSKAVFDFQAGLAIRII